MHFRSIDGRLTRIQAVFFDLDGTLADTAPDMARALNALRAEHDLPAVAAERLRPYASQGARGMLAAGWGITPEDAHYETLRQSFMVHYERTLCVESRLFAGIAQLLAWLDDKGLAWGIVTNKATRYALPLVTALNLRPTADCVVCGDTCERAKPHPDPLLHAAAKTDVEPHQCLYVGDDHRDILAAKAAEMRSIAALYGYLGNSDPAGWNADAAIDHPMSLPLLLQHE